MRFQPARISSLTGHPAVVTGVESRDRAVERAATLLPLALAVLTPAAGVYVFATTLVMVIHSWSAIPFWDQWDELIFNGQHIFSAWLYSQHNEHRLLFPRLFFLIDTFWFAETNKFNFFCNVALPLILAGLVIAVAWRGVARGLTDRLSIAGIVLTALFSAMQYENFVWGFQVQFFAVELAMMAGMVCLVLAGRGVPSLIAAMGFSGIAVYTLASGVVAPFLSIPVAFYAGRSKRQVVVLAIVALGLFGSYLYGYTPPSDPSNPSSTALQPALFLYALAEIGNPFGSLLRQLHIIHFIFASFCFGALGVILFTAAAIGYLRRDAGAGAELVFLAIAGLIIGTTLLTACGRLKLGYEQALSSRYTSPMLLFWVSLAMLGLVKTRHSRALLRPVAMVASVVVMLILTYAQSAFVKTGVAWASPRREAITALLANVDDRGALVRVFPSPDAVRRKAAKLKAEHLSIFADDWSTWLGSPLAVHVLLGNAMQCRGGIDQLSRLPGPGRSEWRVSGWAWDNAIGSGPARVVIADSAGRVVGYGLGGYPTELGSAGPKHAGWHGHFTADDAGAVTAYALVDRERTACPFAD